MAKKRRIVKIIGISLTLLAAVALLLPWNAIIEKRLVALLEAQGMKNIALKVSGIGFSSLELHDVSVGEETPLTLKQLTVDYSLRDLWQGQLKGLKISDVVIEARQSPSGWGIAGLEAFGGKGESTGDVIPVTLQSFPLTHGTVENSQLRIRSNIIDGDVPLHLTWAKSPTPTIDYTAPALTFKNALMSATTGDTVLHLTLDEKQKRWEGKWASKNIAITGLPLELPAVELTGTVTAEANSLAVQGNAKSADGKFKASFTLDYRFDTPERSSFTVSALSLPWNGGTVSVKQVVVPLSGKKAYTIPITLTSISVDALLQPLTGKRATATGSVSGTIPLTLKPDGTYSFGQGALTAEQPGTIVMAPDAIPGDNAQIALVRDVMKDFHYKVLSLALDNDKNNKLSVTLALEGNNPAVYDGRPVKLNVHLNGDVLDFITQSMSINDPQKLIKQSTHAK